MTNWKRFGSSHCLIEVLPHNLPGQTEENHEKLQPDDIQAKHQLILSRI
jgi:hypothetical protein